MKDLAESFNYPDNIMISKMLATCFCCVLAVLFTPTAARGQFQVVGNVISAGGGSSSGGNYSILATVGQAVAGSSDQIGSGFWSVTTAALPTAIEDELLDGELPAKYDLDQNYPNPFNPTTTISFDIRSPGHARLTVFDLLGREVRRLLDGDVEPGRHESVWDGRNSAGVLVGSGIYLYVLDAGEISLSKRMVLLK